jgi:uncharacterized membrane-anchored protein
MSFDEFVATLSFETGSVSIAGGEVTFDLPEGWAILKGLDARKVVEDLWGNPEDLSTLAFIDPPSDDGRLGSPYGVIVSMDESGFVSDEDAAGNDYAEMLKEMKKGTAESNEARTAAGYPTIELVGWAEAPHYDAAEKKLYWAKELKFGGNDENTLNYDVRILGRRGYLQLGAVSVMSYADEVHEGMKTLLPVTNFTEGSRYDDFDSSIDKVAAYGIGGLIAGKVAAKVGLFAVIAKFGKVIVLGIIGLFVAAKKFIFGRDRNEHAYDEDEDERANPEVE